LKKPVENQFFSVQMFNDKAMKQYLTSDAFKGVQGAVQHGTKIDRKLADYGYERVPWGVRTHYTHWFQPLTEQLLKTRCFETS
jgi:glutamine synthetase